MLKLAKNTGTFFLPTSWRQQVRVLVIGCGGTGSEVVDALCRLHHVLIALGHPGLDLFLQDGDTVSQSNCGRQRFLPADVGSYKAEVLARRYGMLMGLPINYMNRYCCKTHLKELRNFKLVISAVDKASFRVQLCEYWRTRVTDTMLLDLGNGASTGQVVFGHLGRTRTDVPRLPNVYDLYPSLATTPDDDEPSCSVEAAIRSQRLGVNRFMADVGVFTVLAPLFTQGEITNHGGYIDMAKPLITPMRIDPSFWATRGYKAKMPKATDEATDQKVAA